MSTTRYRGDFNPSARAYSYRCSLCGELLLDIAERVFKHRSSHAIVFMVAQAAKAHDCPRPTDRWSIGFRMNKEAEAVMGFGTALRKVAHYFASISGGDLVPSPTDLPVSDAPPSGEQPKSVRAIPGCKRLQ